MISGIEKENIHLFAELMSRLKSNNGTKDPDLIGLSSEMRHLYQKIYSAYQKDPNVPFPGDISRTLSLLKESLNIFDSLPEFNTHSQHVLYSPSTTSVSAQQYSPAVYTNPQNTTQGYHLDDQQFFHSASQKNAGSVSSPTPKDSLVTQQEFSLIDL